LLDTVKLTDVVFSIINPSETGSVLREGALSAFLKSDEPYTFAEHYCFSLPKFKDYIAKNTRFRGITEWKVTFEDLETTFDEEASWELMLKRIDTKLAIWDQTTREEPTICFSPFLDGNENQECLPQTPKSSTHKTAKEVNGSPSSNLLSAPTSQRATPQAQSISDDDIDMNDEASSELEADMVQSVDVTNQDQLVQTVKQCGHTTQSPPTKPELAAGIHEEETDRSIPWTSKIDIPGDSTHNEKRHTDEVSQSNTATVEQSEEAVSSTAPGSEARLRPVIIIPDNCENENARRDREKPKTTKELSHVDTSSDVDATKADDDQSKPQLEPTMATRLSPRKSNLRSRRSSRGQSTTRTVTAILEEREVEPIIENEYVDSDSDENYEGISSDVEVADLENTAIAPTQQLLFNESFLNERQWAEICTVLDHPLQARQGGKLLPGTRQPLLIHQMVFIVRSMKAHQSPLELSGLLCADNVGLGKSICALGLFAVNSLVLLNQRHYERHPDLHLNEKETDRNMRCPSNNPYGIQCVCVPGALAKDYARRLVGGPSVLAVPASNLDAWAQRISGYFHRFVMAKGSSEKEVFIEPVYYRETDSLSSIAIDGKEWPAKASDLFSGFRTTSLEVSTVPATTWMPYETLRKRFGREVKLTSEAPDPALFQARFLLLVSFTAFSRASSSFSRIFGVDVPLSRYVKRRGPRSSEALSISSSKSRGQKVKVHIPFAIAVTLFVFDESHLVKGEDTKLFNAFYDSQMLSGQGRRRTRWCFMTATPFSNSPDDISACLKLLVMNKEQNDRLQGQIPDLCRRFRRLQRQASSVEARKHSGDAPQDSTARFARDFANFLRPFTMARDWGSPYLDTCLKDLRPGITYHVEEVSIPAAICDAVERLGTKCRKAVTVMRQSKQRDIKLDDVTKLPVFTQYFSSGIVPGIATILEHDDGADFPSLVKGVDKDLEKGSESIIQKTLHFHKGHAWTRVLTDIIKTAHHDPTARDKRPNHILIVAQTPSLVAIITQFIKNSEELDKITRVTRIYQKITTKAAGRDTFLRMIADEAKKSTRSYVLVTTPRLIGVGVDIVFSSYIIQFGEIFSNRDREQFIGRVNRPGQKRHIHHWHIKSTHSTHEAMRKRNEGRSVMLSEHSFIEASGSGAM
jgi:hypothetical protein